MNKPSVRMNKGLLGLLGGASLAVLSVPAMAITVDLSDAATDVGAAAVAIAAVLVIMLGARLVFSMIRR